jgi:D-alanyl-D-alanine carboxypeptidase
MTFSPRRLLSLALVLLIVLSSALPAVARPLAPHRPEQGWFIPAPPTVDSPSWILYDGTMGAEIASFDPDSRRAPASTTKIMSALVALRAVDRDEEVTVSTRAADAGEAEVGLLAGERFPLWLLVQAMMIRSANDAAVAVAEHIGGSLEGFVDLMNERALELGLENTHFANPHGLDATDHYSSARDLLTMTLAAYEMPGFAQLVRTQSLTFPVGPDDINRDVSSTNRLLNDYEGAIGVKTGFTNQAGLVLVGGAERNGHTLFVVVMGTNGSGGHFSDAATLLDYGFGVTRPLHHNVDSTMTVLFDGSPSALLAEAMVETLVFLNAGALLRPADEIFATAPVETTRNWDEPLPNLQDGLTWMTRYWGWLTGDH